MKTVGIVGQGFVGGTLATVLNERGCTVYSYDKADIAAQGSIKTNSLQELCSMAELVFVCVPTPMLKTGEADLSIVESVLSQLTCKVAVVKSTVPPGSVARWNEMLAGKPTVVFNPEFLTEANCLADMRSQAYIILGGPADAVKEVADFYADVFPGTPIHAADNSSTAEMIKYFANIQLAVRVILSCELAQICERLGDVDYQQVVALASLDKRLGSSHMKVPGPDGIAGARGHCFPKDINALIAVAKSLKIKPLLLEAAWAKNLSLIAPADRDWEQMVGRAVS